MLSQSLQLMQIFLLCLLLLIHGCAKHRLDPDGQTQLVALHRGTAKSIILKRAPVFFLQNIQKSHNRIGMVTAAGSKEAHQIIINSDRPVFYVTSQQFKTSKAKYTNLIYRVHFLEQPFSLFPFHLGAGEHVGLLVILTLDEHERILLVTTAQTCGCYAITLPTQTLSPDFYPPHWPKKENEGINVYGENLPAILPVIRPQDMLIITVRPEVHRVMHISVQAQGSLPPELHFAQMASLDSLKNLSLEDGTATSLYYQSGPLRGHVKGAIKPLETILMGLISFDFFVGMDKEYGDTAVSGNPFYTSLKVWNRNVSDMNDFAGYLKFNGWQL